MEIKSIHKKTMNSIVNAFTFVAITFPSSLVSKYQLRGKEMIKSLLLELQFNLGAMLLEVDRIHSKEKIMFLMDLVYEIYGEDYYSKEEKTLLFNYAFTNNTIPVFYAKGITNINHKQLIIKTKHNGSMLSYAFAKDTRLYKSFTSSINNLLKYLSLTNNKDLLENYKKYMKEYYFDNIDNFIKNNQSNTFLNENINMKSLQKAHPFKEYFGDCHVLNIQDNDNYTGFVKIVSNNTINMGTIVSPKGIVITSLSNIDLNETIYGILFKNKRIEVQELIPLDKDNKSNLIFLRLQESDYNYFQISEEKNEMGGTLAFPYYANNDSLLDLRIDVDRFTVFLEDKDKYLNIRKPHLIKEGTPGLYDSKIQFIAYKEGPGIIKAISL